MSNEKWYKNPIYLVIIATIAAAIISSPIWVEMIFPPPSDFSISINPMYGAVQQGGVITTAITIKGIQGYEYPVSLSSTGQPSGVVVTFVPPIGGPTPSYTSTVTINVDSNVPAGVYTTIIKGTGADGKEHNCNYILTVNPMPVTPIPTPTVTPTPTATPTPPPSFVEVTKPEEKDKVSWRYMVEGRSSATKDSGLSTYVLIWPIEAEGPWWVQSTTTFSDGSWQSYAYFGREGMDIGTTYRVVAIITTQKLRGGQTFKELPDPFAKSKEIIVTRI